MTPGAPRYSNDSESLQADVMRFMAIIAFCLIAILALVRNAEPTAAEATPRQPVPPKVDPVAVTTPDPVSLPVTDPVPPPASDPVPVEPESVLAPIPEPEIQPPLEPLLVVEPPPLPQSLPQAPQRGMEAPPAVEPDPQATTDPAEEAGLILRFASDGDFLRLIARGDIKVYAYLDHDVLGLDGSYRFLDSPAPGQVYELFTASIPSLIVDALKAERRDVSGYRWGIALPQRISSQIERMLGEVSSGQLVIDRFGDVHHVAAS